MALDLNSIFKIHMINLSPTFAPKKREEVNRRESSELYDMQAIPLPRTPKRALEREETGISTTPVKSTPITIQAPRVETTFNEAEIPPESSRPIEPQLARQTKFLESLVDLQEKQNKILERGFDPSDIAKNEGENQLRVEETSRENFEALSNAIDSSQKESTEELSEKIEELSEDIKETPSIPGGGGGGWSLTDLFMGGGGAKGKGNIFKRMLKGGRGLLGKAGTAATTLMPTSLAPTLSTGAGTALTGGAGLGTAALATGGVLAAGAAGYGLGTLLNKGISSATGREDWATAWLTDKREDKAFEEQRKEAYKRFSATHSQAVLDLAGGRDEFNPRALLGLRNQGLIVKKGKWWFTKNEIDEQTLQDLKTRIEKATESQEGSAQILRTREEKEVTKGKIADLMKKREALLSGDYSEEILKQLAPERQIERVKGLAEQYKTLSVQIDKVSGSQQKQIANELAQIQNVMMEITGKNIVEFNEAYRDAVTKTITDEMEKIVPEFKAQLPTGKEQITEAEQIAFVENKRDEIISELRNERVATLENEIEKLKESKKGAESYAEAMQINKSIKKLEAEKEKLEALTAAQYKEWLTAAVEAANQRLESLERKKHSFWKTIGPEQIKEAEYEEQEKLDLYRAEQARIDAITRTAVAAAPVNLKEPAPVPTTFVEKTKELERAKTIETRETIRGEGKKEGNTQVINVQQTQQASPSVRSTKVDDYGTEFIRSNML